MVSCPSPRLARDSTSLLIVSIEVVDSERLGSDKPKTSHRIFGLLAPLFFFAFAASRFHALEIFISNLLLHTHLMPEQPKCIRDTHLHRHRHTDSILYNWRGNLREKS